MATTRKTMRGGAQKPAYTARDAAVREIVMMLPEVLADPLTLRSVGLEVRYHGDGPAWDLATIDGPSERWQEIKSAQPSGEDIRDFAKRVNKCVVLDGVDVSFELHYGDRSASVETLRRLADLAKERGSVALDDLITGTAFEREVFTLFGANAAFQLRLVRVIALPADAPNTLRPAVASLVGDTSASELLADLRTRVEQAPRGGVIDVSVVAREVVMTRVPKPIVLRPGRAYQALAIAVTVPDPIPLAAIAAALQISEADLRLEVAPLLSADLLAVDDADMVRPGATRWSGEVADQAALLRDALAALIAFCTSRTRALTQVGNLLRLGEACLDPYPEVAAGVFGVAQHAAKDIGNWSVLHDLAEVTTNAAARVPRSESTTKAYATALICGTAWVLQRSGELEDAQIAIEKARSLCRFLHWPENDAFAAKCMGRLFRMRADLLRPRSSLRIELLEDSERELLEAIRIFVELGNSAEAGDAYSLLARTYLVWGRIADADQMIASATGRLDENSGKDYIDLLLLMGDLELARATPHREFAAAFFQRAFDLCGEGRPEVSEMRARAHVALARVAANADAAGHLNAAAEIYEQLGDHHAGARYRVEALRLTRARTTELQRFAERGLKDLEIVHALRHHDEQNTALMARGRAVRQRVPTRDARYWDEIAIVGRRRAAQYDRPWR